MHTPPSISSHAQKQGQVAYKYNYAPPPTASGMGMPYGSMSMGMDTFAGSGGGLGMGFALNTLRYDPTTMSVGGGSLGRGTKRERTEDEASGALGLVGTGR